MRARVMECVRVGGGYRAIIEYPAAWIGWRYAIEIDGVRVVGFALLWSGKPALACTVKKPLSGVVEISESRPIERLWPW